jgi:hypothetical protein
MTKDTRINVVNIGLMMISCCAAFLMPFEVFLFAYAVLGPLHYLTEISWLHDRQYFSKGKYDFVILLSIGIIITWDYLSYKYHIWPYSTDEESMYKKATELNIGDKFLLLALFGSIVMAFVKNLPLKLISLFLIFAFINNWLSPTLDDEGNPVRNNSTVLYVLTSFVPTLIHVYVFTGFFILYGALKSRSRSGVISFIVFVVCPLLLVSLFQNEHFVKVTEYGMNAYGSTKSSDGFFDLSQSILGRFFDFKADYSKATTEVQAQQMFDQQWTQFVYYSKTGILLMRFIAFAYLYHYLNWFSKTEVIRWHKVPKKRFIAVIVLWAASLFLYGYNYALGLQWLFFLSFSHVLLEFPLNFISIAGIGKEGYDIVKNGFRPKAA